MMKKGALVLALLLAGLNVVYFTSVGGGDHAEGHDAHGDHGHGDHGHDDHGHDAHGHDAHGEHGHDAHGADADGHGDGHHSEPASLVEVFTANNPTGEGALPSGWRMAATIGNFLLLVMILVGFGREPMGNFLSGRKEALAQGLEEAARLKTAAEAKQKEYADRLAKLDEEIDTLRKDMTKAGEDERDRIVQEATRRAERMRQDAEFLISQQMKQLRDDLTTEAVEAAISAAEAVLRDKTTTTDQQRLADAYLQRIAQSTDSAGGRA